MLVKICDRQRRPMALARIRRIAERTLAALGAGTAELSVALVGDAEMRALNRCYRRLDRTTDVLAFPQIECGLLGDVVVSVETASRRVGDAPRRLEAEVARYLIHGILHLTGWGHYTPAARRRMRRQEQELLALWDGGDSGGASAAR